MITGADVEKLGAIHAVEPTVLSLYLSVPLHPAELPSLTARADELVAAALAWIAASVPVPIARPRSA